MFNIYCVETVSIAFLTLDLLDTISVFCEMLRSIILLIIIISANLLYAIKGIPNSIRARNCLLQIECNSICRLPLKKTTTLKQLSTRGVKSTEGKPSFDRSANDSSKDIVQLRKRRPIPVSLSILRNGLYKHREPLPSFHMLPRKAFDDIAHPTSDGIPVLMEAFTFCQQRDLVFNSVINLFYLGENIKHRKAYQFSKCQAELNGFTAEDEMVDDPLSRVIISSFRFPGMCSSRNNEIAISCDTINSTYHITPIHIHYENTTRYYLSVCTSIANVDPLLVRAWIYYYYANGVEHFTFYLNEQKEFWKRILRDFQQTGLVDLLDFEYKYHISHRDQEAALESCNLRYRNTSRFVIYNDIDEFFVPMNPKWRIVDVVHLYDSLYPNADAFRVISIRWYEM